MRSKYFVIGECDCGRCNGGGVIWEGYENPVTGRWDRREVNCPVCDGTGQGERRVSLEDALEDLLQPGSDLLEFVARMLAEQAELQKPEDTTWMDRAEMEVHESPYTTGYYSEREE